MRRSEDMPLDPFAAAELEAIEAALAGREVDPEHAELAELSVLLATDHQYPDAPFTRDSTRRSLAGSGNRLPGRARGLDLAPGAWGRPYGGLAAIVVLAIHPATPTVLNGPARRPGLGGPSR